MVLQHNLVTVKNGLIRDGREVCSGRHGQEPTPWDDVDGVGGGRRRDSAA